ncbi:uncharacterized protein LOC115632693 [Scaptodrosophila lebanonensis]|uniref:Uncharacterized protein LOC115632693 n=1 Tax=Drosophila lebanonensis TaxID=7225 RepID=A0A6J2UCJ2_DROLE|nr:uncharacterized protein LOC115632693 [Scaptodrosophila lebanonensis]
MSVQQFCLRWNNHQPNFISVCSSLLHNGTLVDVTLAAEGRQLQAHKIVLSACSSYFQALFTTNPCQHPIVILKDVQYDDLKTMVDFMYYGEVNVSQEQLPHILKTAEMLKIKGLAEMPTDPANLTKSDSKSSSEGTELVGGQSGANVASSGTAAGSLGAGSANSVGDSMWSSSEAQQFQQQQQQAQQQQQHHHHQQQQQLQQQQQQQQQQQAQQQQQQHHHHHHHQQQQQQQQPGNQSQTPQSHHHQLRRTPSPLGAGTSPATRRKRLRKSSNNGSGERNNSDEQHNSSMDAGSAAGNAGLSLAQMSQMSFGSGTNTALGNLTGHSLHAAKLLKESASTELDQQPQDSDLDDGHGHIHMQIKPEVDIGGVNQSIPLDISGATTPSEHDAPNSQSSHSEPSTAHTHPLSHSSLVAANSSSSSFERTSSIGGHNESEAEAATDLQVPQSAGMMGTKRNRVLTRQPRVKRDSDSLSSTNQISPDTGANTAMLDFDPFNAAGVTTATDYSTGGPHQHQHHQNQHQQSHHHHHLLTVPPRMERHASEPAPSLISSSSSSPHLLTVPPSTPYLIKQHSDPLLPRQHSLHASGSGSITTGSNPFAPLTRQYSHPLPGSNAGYVPPAPLHLPHHISLPEPIYASGSPPPAGSSQYLVPTRVLAPASSSEAAATPAIASTAAVSVVTSPTIGLNSSSCRQSFSPTFAGSAESERRSPYSQHIVIERSAKNDAGHGGGAKLRSSKSASGVSSSGTHLHPGQPTTSSSFEHLPTLRVKNEELQRSVSSPQTQREIITLENPRSSHCPVIRPGPALGCNFCWNTIDGHGRILRRKTKYHCPECQTNLCIVPCFQEYHERLNNEAAAGTNENQINSSSSSSSSKGSAYATTGGGGAARHYTKTESIVVNHLKTIFAARHIHAGNVNQIGELRLVMILQELQHGHHTFGCNENLELITSGKLDLLHILRQTFGDIATKIRQMGSSNCIWLAHSGCKELGSCRTGQAMRKSADTWQNYEHETTDYTAHCYFVAFRVAFYFVHLEIKHTDWKKTQQTMNHLKWMGHMSTIMDIQRSLYTARPSLRDDTETCEVTLVAKDGISVRAHLFVLSTCSDLMRSLLVDVPAGQEATVVLPDIRGEMLESMMSFIYMGETTLQSTYLTEFLEAINLMGIKSAISFECNSASAMNTSTAADEHLAMEAAKSITGLQIAQAELLEEEEEPPSTDVTDKLEGGAEMDDPQQQQQQEHHHQQLQSGRQVEYIDVYTDQPKITYSIEHMGGTTSGNQYILTENTGTFTITQSAAPATKMDTNIGSVNEVVASNVSGNLMDDDAEDVADDVDESNLIEEEYVGETDPLIEMSTNARMDEPDGDDMQDSDTKEEHMIELKPRKWSGKHKLRRSRGHKSKQQQFAELKSEAKAEANDALELAAHAVLQEGLSLQKAADRFEISKTVLWRRVRNNPEYMKHNREKPSLSEAYERLKNGDSLKSISQDLHIPMSTLHRHKVRLAAQGRLPDFVACRRRDTTPKDELRDKLAKAVHACIHEGMSQNHAANLFEIPKSTLWRHLQRRVAEAEQKVKHEQDDEDEEEILA